jgi:hypothetical protein
MSQVEEDKPAEQTEEEKPKDEESKTESATQDKVLILFKAVGDTPILKKSKAKINSSSQFREVISYIRKLLKMKADQSLVRQNVSLI